MIAVLAKSSWFCVYLLCLIILIAARSKLQNDRWLLEPNGWFHPSAMIVNSDIGRETDENEYKSLNVPQTNAGQKPPPMHPCKDADEVLKKVKEHSKEINAMLNHHTSGIIAFGIQDKGNKVEEGLNLDQEGVMGKLNIRVGQLLQGFFPAVQSSHVRIQSVNLLDSSNQPTGRWRFDIHVMPYGGTVYFTRDPAVVYYRQGGASMQMPADAIQKVPKVSK